MEGARVFWFFCGYIIRCIWIWYDRNRENSLLFYCLVSMIWFTIATNFPWKLLRTCLKDMLTPNLEVCFLLKRGTWSPIPPATQTWSVFIPQNWPKWTRPKRMGHLWRCQRVPSTLANLEPTAPEAQFLEDCARISTTDWKKNCVRRGGSMMKLNEPSHCLEVLFFVLCATIACYIPNP